MPSIHFSLSENEYKQIQSNEYQFYMFVLTNNPADNIDVVGNADSANVWSLSDRRFRISMNGVDIFTQIVWMMLLDS